MPRSSKYPRELRERAVRMVAGMLGSGGKMRATPPRPSYENRYIPAFMRESKVRLLQTHSKHCIATKTLTDVRIQAESEQRPVGVDGPIRGSARQLRPDEVDQLIARYEVTQKIRSVANEFGLYRATVREHLKRRSVDVRQVRSMTDPEKAEAVRLYEAGDSSVTIGAKLGFSNNTVVKALRA